MLQSEIGSTLESNKLPFYTLGGAGKHFPRKGRNGMPIYPENSRRPGKILRRMVRILQRGGIQDWDEDWSGDREPGVAGLGHGKVEMDREERIRSLDLDGEWFDCHDIQGYLEHRGVALDGSALRLEVPAALVGHLHGFSPDRSVSSLYTSPEEVPVDRATSVSSPSPYMLDMECFFDRESPSIFFSFRQHILTHQQSSWPTYESLVALQASEYGMLTLHCEPPYTDAPSASKGVWRTAYNLQLYHAAALIKAFLNAKNKLES
jgi:hypothetical protein